MKRESDGEKERKCPTYGIVPLLRPNPSVSAFFAKLEFILLLGWKGCKYGLYGSKLMNFEVIYINLLNLCGNFIPRINNS